MTRRNVKPDPNLLVRAPLRQHWPPACPAGCGFIGEPNDRLIEQLKFEGFTRTQAAHAADQVGL